MNDDERDSLASLYAKWETSRLTDALARNASQYDPRALELMTQELAKRRVATQEVALASAPRAHALAPVDRDARQASTSERPCVRYVGAWVLCTLLSIVMGLPSALALRGIAAHHGDAIFALFWIVVWGISSFVAFRLSVKRMIVDRLSGQRPLREEADEAQQTTAPYSDPAARSPQG
jgi:hypothetical protein